MTAEDLLDSIYRQTARRPPAPSRIGGLAVTLRLRVVALAILALACEPAPAPLRAQAAAAPGGDSVVYRVSPASRFEVRTGTAGLLGFAGHEHLIRAGAFSGRAVYYPSAPLASHVEIRIAADSLEVLTPPDTAEIRKVTEAMRTEVLHVERNREITFASRTLAAVEGGFRMTGTLTMAGQAREVRVDARVAIGRDTLRATATFAVKQTDFGIRPYRGGPGGTVRVADRVSITLAVVAVREK